MTTRTKSRYVRILAALRPEQLDRLKAASEDTGAPVVELIRRAIDATENLGRKPERVA